MTWSLFRHLFLCPRGKHRWAASWSRSSFRRCRDCPEIGWWVAS